nr:hypothetical protein [Tanacetum cinerariifolium]
MVALAFEAEVVLQLMLPGDATLLAGAVGDGVAQVHVVALAGAFGAAQDAAHLRITRHGLHRAGVGATHAGYAAIGAFENEVHGILMLEAAFGTVAAEHAVAHHLLDIGQ